MRQVLSFAIASAILCGGLYLIYFEFAEAKHAFGKLIVAGSFMSFVGAAWLWADFIGPLFGRKELE